MATDQSDECVHGLLHGGTRRLEHWTPAIRGYCQYRRLERFQAAPVSAFAVSSERRGRWSLFKRAAAREGITCGSLDGSCWRRAVFIRFHALSTGFSRDTLAIR